LKVQLAEQNRVRLEQVRDMIEQDGTKAKTAVVTVKGELSQIDGKWVLQPPSLPSAYEVEAASPAAGTFTIAGEVVKLKPESGRRIGLIQSGGDVEPAFPVHLQSIRTAGGAPVEDQFTAVRSNGSVGFQIEAPQLACGAHIVVVIVGHVQVAIAG